MGLNNSMYNTNKAVSAAQAAKGVYESSLSKYSGAISAPQAASYNSGGGGSSSYGSPTYGIQPQQTYAPVSATQANAGYLSAAAPDVTNFTKGSDGAMHGVLSAQQVADLKNRQWMGNQYSRDSNGFFTTNPSNSNSARYSADGRPAATLGFYDQKTGNSYNGLGAPEQFSQLMGTRGNPDATISMYNNMINSGQLGKPLSAGQANAPAAAAMKSGAAMPSAMRWNVNAPYQDRLSRFGTNTNDAQNELLSLKQMYESEKAAGASQERLSAISSWANQVRQSSGISADDQNYGNSNAVSWQDQAATTNRLINNNMVSDPSPAGGTPPPTTDPTTPPPTGGVVPGQLTLDQIKAQAAAQIAAQRSGIEQAANAAKEGLKNNLDYTNQITNDSRALEDQTFLRNNSPFSGRSDYLATNLLRNRSIQDTASNKDYNSAVASENAKIANFDALAPGQQQALMNDLQRKERDYGLQVGTLTGNINGYQTLAGKQVDLAAQNQQFNQQQAVKQQRIDLAGFLTQQFGVLVKPTEDPMMSYAQVAGIPTAAAQKIAMDAANMSFDNAIKLALANNTIDKTQADKMQQAQQLGISQQNANTSAASAGNTSYNQNQQRLIEIWKTQGTAPDGINGVAAGTAYTGLGTSSGNKNNLESTYISNIEQMTTSMRTDFFKNEKAAIIKDVGITGYNQMYSTYFDQNGDPK